MEFSVLNLFLVLLAAWVGGRIAARFDYPAVLGELLAGIALGPPLLGVIAGSDALAVLAEVGVLLMMLYIGMEIDPRELGEASVGGLLAALGGFVVPFGLGVWVVTAFGGTVLAGLFVGMAMGLTSLAIKSRILVDLRILDTRIAHVMMAGALVADTLSLLIFAGIVSFATAGALDVLGVAWIALKAAAFFAVAWLLGTRGFPPLYRWLGRRGLRSRTFNATLVLLIALAFAEIADLAGFHGILGAFVAGLALRDAIAERRLSFELGGWVRDVSLGFLAPVFFVTAGFEVSFAVFRDSLGLLLAVIALATVGRIVGTALAYLPSGHGWREGVVIGAGMNGRGAVEIVVAGIGLQAGIIDREIFSILVVMAIATTVTVPVLLAWGVRWLERRDLLVRSGGRNGVVIVGAGPVARLLAKRMAAGGAQVTLIDRNEAHCRAARAEGLRAVHGDALATSAVRDAGIDAAGTLIALTPNAEINALAVKLAHDEFGVPTLRALLTRESDGGIYGLLERIGAAPFTPNPVDLETWDRRVAADAVREVVHEIGERVHDPFERRDALPLLIRRDGGQRLFGNEPLRPGDRIVGLEPLA